MLAIQKDPKAAALRKRLSVRLEELTQKAQLSALASGRTAPPSAADRFQYRLTIDDGPRRHVVEIGESAMPESLRPLIDWLTATARKSRGR